MDFLREFFKKYIMNDLELKIIAVVIAILMWFSMTYLGESKMTYSVPIAFDNLGKSFSMRDADTRDVTITLNGPLSDLKNLKPKDIKVTLDLSRVREGRQTFSLRKSDVVVPNSVKIERVEPDYVVVEIDKIMEKNLRTIVKLGERWEAIYQVISWSPRSAVAEGSENALAGKGSIETIPIDSDLRQQQEIIDVPLNIKSLAVRKIRPETVHVVLKRITR